MGRMRADLIDTDPITLTEASRVVLRGVVGVAALRAEMNRGNLAVFKIGRNLFTTPAAIREMMEKCRVQPVRHASTSVPTIEPGSSATKVETFELATLKANVAALRSGSLSTLPVKLSPRLMAHLKRWRRLDGPSFRHVIHWNGSSVQSIKKAFRTATVTAALEGQVIPHTLRHTAATWLMQAGVEPWDAAGFLGMTVDMLVRTYGHFSPEFQKGASEAIGRRA